MITVIPNDISAELNQLAGNIAENISVDEQGFVSIDKGDELFAASLPEGITPEVVANVNAAQAQWQQASMIAFNDAVAQEVKGGSTLSSFTMVDVQAGVQHQVSGVVGDGKIELTSIVSNPNDTSNALMASLAQSFANFVAGE